MTKIKSLDLISEVVQRIIEGLPQVTSRDIKVWETAHHSETLKPGDRDFGELGQEMKKLLLLLYNDYDDIIEKERRGEISSLEDRRKYLMARLAWRIFWDQIKVEMPEIPLDAEPEDLFFYKGFNVVIQEEIPENIVPFTGTYNPRPTVDLDK